MGHLRSNGYEVKTVNISHQELQARKAAAGLTPELSSCHTGEIQGYTVEGHVPADVLDRFLAEKPEAAGLTVPGMPTGSPGMESDHRPAEHYAILAFDTSGKVWEYAKK